MVGNGMGKAGQLPHAGRTTNNADRLILSSAARFLARLRHGPTRGCVRRWEAMPDLAGINRSR